MPEGGSDRSHRPEAGPRVDSARCRTDLASNARSSKLVWGERTMIHVIAIITAKPGHREEVIGHFKAIVPAVHAEKGCIEYRITVDADAGPFAKVGTDTFVVIEKWQSMDDLKAHIGADAGLQMLAKTEALLADRVVHILEDA